MNPVPEHRSAYDAVLSLPCATVGIRVEGDALTAIDFITEGTTLGVMSNPTIGAVLDQLHAYFADPRHCFDLPLALHGTPFQRRVWEALRAIPPGQVLSYGGLAQQLGTSARAVGGACGANPVPIVVPCHRVVAVHGLGGYGGAGSRGRLDIKRWLLSHEGWPGLAGAGSGGV
jgi:methylated-DNA-[protein]-cysteine S-methyltransferase